MTCGHFSAPPLRPHNGLWLFYGFTARKKKWSKVKNWSKTTVWFMLVISSVFCPFSVLEVERVSIFAFPRNRKPFILLVRTIFSLSYPHCWFKPGLTKFPHITRCAKLYPSPSRPLESQNRHEKGGDSYQVEYCRILYISVVSVLVPSC